MKKRHALVSVLLLCLPIFACDDDDDDDDDDLIVITTDGGQAGMWPGTCDPVLQNFPTGQQCVGGCNVVGVTAKVFTCAVPNPTASATQGQECGTGCARGYDCFTVTDMYGASRNVCRKYCNTNADCPNGGTCVAEGLICTPGDTSPIGRVCSL